MNTTDTTIEPLPYRELVVPEHRPFFDRIVELTVAGGADADHPLTLPPGAWAALVTALVQSVQIHRLLMGADDADAVRRLPLVEALLTHMTNAESVDEVLPLVDIAGVQH